MTKSELYKAAKASLENRKNTDLPVTKTWLHMECQDIDSECTLDQDVIDRIVLQLGASLPV